MIRGLPLELGKSVSEFVVGFTVVLLDMASIGGLYDFPGQKEKVRHLDHSVTNTEQFTNCNIDI